MILYLVDDRLVQLVDVDRLVAEGGEATTTQVETRHEQTAAHEAQEKGNH